VEREQLVFRQYAIDLGLVPPVGTVPAYFDFRNQGDEPIEIVDLEASCGCLAPRLYDDKKTIYEPGEGGRFYVTVKTANETPGPKSFTVLVKYDDGQPKERVLSFRLEIPERKVTVSPAQLLFYQINGEPDSREITLSDYRGASLNVLNVRSESELVSLSVGEKVQSGENSTIPIRIDVAALAPPGRQEFFVTIETDDPEYKRIQVPVMIFGPENPIRQVSGEQPTQQHIKLKDDHQPESKSSDR